MAKVEIPAYYFQQALHLRKYSPKKNLSYKNKEQRAFLKTLLRREFARKCIYCRRSDSLCRKDQFGIDHYKPKSKFPDLIDEYSNLFQACNTCNRLKSNFWPSAEQISAGIFIPNPCDYIMTNHLKFVGAKIKEQSTAGEWTIDQLHLNDSESIKHREFLNKTYLEFKYKLSRVEKQLKKNISVLSKKNLNHEEVTEVTEKQRLLVEAKAEIKKYLFRLIGE